MRIPLAAIGLLVSEIANDNDIFLVDELIEFLGSVDGELEIRVLEDDE